MMKTCADIYRPSEHGNVTVFETLLFFSIKLPCYLCYLKSIKSTKERKKERIYPAMEVYEKEGVSGNRVTAGFFA